MVAQALMPFAIGRAIQNGIVDHNNRSLAIWALTLLGLGLMQAFCGVMRHRYAVFNWLQASFRLAQVVAHHAARSGPAARAQLSTGEVVATISNDAMRAGGAFDITARLAGALVSYVVVAFILLSSSVPLGLVVLVGVPVLVLLLGLIIKPLQARQRDQREQVGQLTALGADTAAGLRVLRGIGGEQEFFDRYRRRSQEVRQAGVRVALPQSTLDAAQVFIPGLFVVLVTWIGARFALSGQDRHRRPRRVLRLRSVPRAFRCARRRRPSTRSRVRSSARAGCSPCSRSSGRRSSRSTRGRAARRRAARRPRSGLVVSPGR